MLLDLFFPPWQDIFVKSSKKITTFLSVLKHKQIKIINNKNNFTWDNPRKIPNPVKKAIE